MLHKFLFLFFTSIPLFTTTCISNCTGKISDDPENYGESSGTSSNFNNEDYVMFSSSEPLEPEELTAIKKFMKFYPDLEFSAEYDDEVSDWKVSITKKLFLNRPEKSESEKLLTRKADFYWAGGRLLPKSELSKKDDYWVLQYKYENVLRDPKTYTPEEIERIKDFASSKNRKKDNGTPMFFFDFIYSAKSRPIIEEHIVKTKFLGKTTKVHERILPALKRVEAEICMAAGISVEDLSSAERIAKIDVSSEKQAHALILTDEQKEIRKFIKSLRSSDAYYWREIAGTNRKSFHSYGIAVDLLPNRLNGRSIYWGWEKERSGDKWMMVPPEARWAPPEAVIKIFEEHGFIWGGYWVIFDNMHFEYHPELIQ
jgi:hypothetical protein